MTTIFLRRLAFVATMFVSVAVHAQPVAKVAVFANGNVELDGRRVSAAVLDEALKVHAAKSGVVWYYRENPTAQPHANADVVLQTIIRHRLPVSMSTKPDFSDYVDPGGVSRPRK